MNRNYMVIRSENGMDDRYTIRMISGNKIPGLLQFQEKWINGMPLFYYDITSRQPLRRFTEYKSLTGVEIRTLISDLIFVLRQMERYLLDEQRICLRTESIYIEPETFHGSFCLIPGYQSDFTTEFLEFAQYILDHVDHSDGDAVVLAFSIFRESRKGNFGVDDIERCLGKSSPSTEIAEIPKTKYEELTVIEDTELSDESFDFSTRSEEAEGWQSKQIILGFVLIVMMTGLPVVSILLFGIRFLVRWKWVFLIAEIMLAAIGIRILYFSEEEEAEDSFEIEALTEWEFEEAVLEPEEDDDMQTILLISQTEVLQKRKLISISDRKEIAVEYFPFLIGKNKGLVDLCLCEPSVSRLHAKIEQDGDSYFVTDLNSTNGTKINGFLLGANERKQIYIGDELELAGIMFRFQ